jgi:uncharacterized protein (TIGR03790 family)
MPRQFSVAALVAFCCACAVPASAQTGDNVLVVANTSAAGSVEIAERYVAARKVPADHLLRVKASSAVQIARDEYEREIQEPVSAWLFKNAAQDRILYIVLTRGMPLRIAGTAGRSGTTASVDSEMAVMYRRLTGAPVAPNGPVPNPYFLADGAVEQAKPFTHAAFDIYLVTRLDGFTVADALALIDRGLAPARTGRIVLDEPPSTGDLRSTWFDAAATRLAASGLADRVVHDATSRALTKEADVLGYASWGSNDPALEMRQPELTFVNGALASMVLSSDARTFAEPPDTWKPSHSSLQANYAGSNQSLIGDLIRQGITGVAGQVSEPYLDGAIRPDVLFPAYVRGFNLAEAFYMAMPYVSWQTVVVGDPLCAPFRSPSLTLADPDPALDPETELPARFSARRLAAVQRPGADPALMKLMLLADTRRARGDFAGAVQALQQAVGKDATSLDAWRTLGTAFESATRFSDAADAYRRTLDLDRNDVVALNNLAYIMAVRENRPQEALPLATRAATLSRNNPTVSDTLGWIHYLTGNKEEALRLLTVASRALPAHPEVQFHAAVVFGATGRLEDAAKALKIATDLDSSFKDRPEATELERKIAGSGTQAK